MQAWQATVQNEQGNVVFNPSVTVYLEDGVTLAPIFNEDGSPKANPFIGSLEGFVQFWAEDGTYKILGANGADLTELWEVTLGPLSAFITRDEFVGVSDQKQVRDVVIAGGVAYQRDPTLSLPSLNNWRPVGDTLDIRHVGSASELSSDFVGRFSQAVDDAASEGWDFNLSRKQDGTPYEYQFIDHTLTGDIRINFDSNALLMPLQNFQHFSTGGTTGPFTITEFPYNSATDLPLSAMLVTAAGGETKLNQGAQFTVSGNVVTLTSTPAAGSTLVVVMRTDAMGFRGVSGDGRRLILDGDVTIDMSRVGYAVASASGSGLTTTNVDNIIMNRLWCTSPAGYGTGPLERRADSAFVPLNFKSCYANHIHAEGMNDLAVYASGGGNAGPADDSKGLQIGSIYAKRCQIGMKYVRQGEQGYIGSISVEECGNGFITGTTSGLYQGGGIHIGSINAVKLGRRALSAEGMLGQSLHVGSISVRDIGYLPDGVTRSTGTAAVFLGEASGVQVDYLDIRQVEWPSPPTGPDVMAVHVSGANVYGNRVLGGWVDGIAFGIYKSGPVSNNAGNVFNLTMKDVATPLNAGAVNLFSYDIFSLTETGGVVSNQRINSETGVRETGGQPTFLLSGAVNSPSYSYSEQNLSYQKSTKDLQFSLSITGTITHTETAKEFRVYMVSQTVNGFSGLSPVTIGRMVGVNVPSGRIYADMPPGANYVRFRYQPVDGSNPVAITSDHIASGGTVIIELSGVVPA